MTERNPSHAADIVIALLRDQFGDEVEDVQPLSGGFFSRAFAFTAAGHAYVIRLNPAVNARESFAKDEYAWRHFASPALPIPRIVAIGATPAGYYAISERVAGRPLHDLSLAERRAVLPALLDTLEVVGWADIGASRGYGDWGSDGNGRFATWPEYLTAIMANHSDGYYQDWHQLFSNSFLEREVFETVYRRMLHLSTHCPEERALIHNDFQFENVLADGERITGVIDWGNALFGDPLYDVAWLTWQSAHPGWWYEDGAQILHTRFGAAPHFAARITCYLCHIGLDHLRFCAKNGQRDKYQVLRDQLLSMTATVLEI